MVGNLYLALVQALDARRRALGWTCEQLDDAAGTQDRYWAKVLHADAPSGRVAGWETLQLYADALWPAGCNLLALDARHIDRKRRRVVLAVPANAQRRLDLGGDVMLPPARPAEPKAVRPARLPIPAPANDDVRQLALAVDVDTSPGRYRSAVSEAKRHGPKRIYRRGGGRAA